VPGAGSPAPLFAGVAAVVLAAFGLLLTTTSAVMIAAFIASGAGTASDPQGDALAPGLLAGVNGLACVGVLIALALLIGGRDAGRSATVWLAGVTMPWVLLTGFFFAVAVDDIEDGRRAHEAALLGVAGAGLAGLGLLFGTILLGIRPGRRWLAHRILFGAAGRPDVGAAPAAEPPAPLRAAWPRFSVALLVIFAAGVCLLVFMPLSGMNDDPVLTEVLIVVAVLHLVFVSVPLVVAGLGARSARAGRRGGAVLARVFSAVPLLVLPVFVLLAGFIGVVTALLGGEDDDAVLPSIVAIAVSGMLTVAFLAGIGLVLAGLAALADPRSELHLRRR
jgi:hypothetical protein